MRKLYPILLTLLIFFTASNLFAQTKTRLEKEQAIYKAKGDIDFNLFKFRSSAALYLRADTTNVAVIGKLAESYKAFKNYYLAEHWFEKQVEFPNQPDQLLLDYAEILANNGRYKLSSFWYGKYAAKHPLDRRAGNLAKTFDKLNVFREDSVNWVVDYPTFNTPKDEFSPVYFNRGLIFTSNRDMKWGIKQTFGWNETPFTDLYMLEDTATIKTVKPEQLFSDSVMMKVTNAIIDQRLPKTINDNRILGDITYPLTMAFITLQKDTTRVSVLSKDINTSLHDGPMSLSADRSEIFYNRNNYRKSDEGKKGVGIYKLNMFSAKYAGGKWYDVKPFPYNSLEYSTAHPALTPDGKTLYFVSDMPGGYGGKDIYYCLREGDTWSKPVNIGPIINTEGDEVFPFIAPDGTMYFSSNGHTGLGGLDLFKVTLKNNEPTSEPTNLGMPINSSKDDFGFIIDKENASGYFSSNRYQSDDIFKFAYRPMIIKLIGKIQTDYLAGSKIAVPNAKVTLKYGNNVDTVMSDNIGKYAFTLTRNIPYTITAEKPGFTGPATDNVTTVGISKSTTLTKDLILEAPKPPVVAPPLDDCARFAKVFAVENIFYDLDKYFIRKDALPAMNHLLKIMKDYPEVSVMIKSHTDSRASAAYNVKLSSNRAKAAVNWLVEHGIARNRLFAEYFGERKLVNDCGDGVDCSEDIHQLNRRSEFYLFINGKNITIDCK